MFEATTKVHQVELGYIDSSDRAKTREKLGDISKLAESLKTKGLINPIILNRNDDGTYTLIHGLRRLHAAKMLKWPAIPSRYYNELSEYERRLIYVEDAVLNNQELSWQERAKLLQEAHILYERQAHENPEPQPATPQLRKPGPKPKWSKTKTAKRLGISKSLLTEDIKLAEMMKKYPELNKAISRQDALNKMYRVAEQKLLAEISRRQRAGKKTNDPVDQRVQFHHGSCYDLMLKMPDNSIDFVVTDPPWAIDIKTIGKRQLDYDHFDDKGEVDHYVKAIPELARVMKDGSHLWIFHTQLDCIKVSELLEKSGFSVCSLSCVWVKKGPPSYTNRYEYQPMPGHELFTFAVLGNNPRRLNEACNSVFRYKRAENPIHATEKPIELIKRLVGLSSNEGDVGFDPFAGSGVFLQACLVSGRRAIGCEVDEKLFDKANGRLQAMLIGQKSKDEKVS